MERCLRMFRGANDFDCPFSEVRDVKKGGHRDLFIQHRTAERSNANVIKQAKELIAEYKGMEILIYPVERKLPKPWPRRDTHCRRCPTNGARSFTSTTKLASPAVDGSVSERNVDKVVLLYHRYHGIYAASYQRDIFPFIRSGMIGGDSKCQLYL